MKELEIQIADGSLYFIRQGARLEVSRYQGLAGHVEIPANVAVEAQENMADNATAVEAQENLADNATAVEVHSLPVAGIGKKAFLSKKYLRSVTIPAGVAEVGDWAFAYCDALREVTFEGRNVTFGKSVFLECPNLHCVRFPGMPDNESGSSQGFPCGGSGSLASSGQINGGSGSLASSGQTNGGSGSLTSTGYTTYCDGIGALTAAAVTQMESSYLLDASEIGSAEWLTKWDARMFAILGAADDEGYSKQILCGEEDYESADLETYLTNSRKKKVRLLLLRLLAPMGLDPVKADGLRSYLLAHTKGCQTEETWQVVRDEYGDRREFYELFATIGCFTKENAPSIIAETKEEHPEMKAFFLKYQADHFADHDFFAELEL
ncbi:MAG: leucine-rich repeat domain-containing protein [Acetatifactor sp.]|nr:leucine-rich repeat domain-containing protein [Acetatifactor sp.]